MFIYAKVCICSYLKTNVLICKNIDLDVCATEKSRALYIMSAPLKSKRLCIF